VRVSNCLYIELPESVELQTRFDLLYDRASLEVVLQEFKFSEGKNGFLI